MLPLASLGETGRLDHPSEPTCKRTAIARRRGPGRAQRAREAGCLDGAEHGGRLLEGRRARSDPAPRQGAFLVRFLAKSARFPGIGEAAAHRLWDALGERLYAVLGGDDPSELVPLLGGDRASDLLLRWQDNLAESDVAVWLDENSLDGRLAAKVVRVWGVEGVAKLRANPYVMLTFADWKAVDAAALRVGVSPDDPRRLVGAVEGALYARLGVKHTAVSRADLEGAVGVLVGSTGRGAMAVDLAVSDGAAVQAPTPGLLQPAGAAVMERYVEGRIRSMLAPAVQPGLFGAPPDGAAVDAELDRIRPEQGQTLTDEQRAGVSLAVRSQVALLLGGAGVGKTTVLRALHGVCRRAGRPILQMALAGRAAQRMREATGEQAYTIAGFLLSVGSGRLEVPGGALIVVDEASMLDLPSVYRLLRAIPDTAGLLLVGDPAQLPPIGFGLVFHVMADAPFVPRAELTRVHRQAEATGIPLVAASIRRGDVPALPRFDGRAGFGVSVLPCAPDRVGDAVEDVVASLGGYPETQILSPLRQGPSGIRELNGRFHALLSPGRTLLPRGDIAVGDPVMWTVNDWRRGLTNGSLGIVRAVAPDGRATVEFDVGSFDLEPGEDQWPLALAYAITVHKAQGSQFRRVVMPMFASRILDRTLVYTAVTRATDQVVIVGDLEAFNRAVAAPPSADRRVVGLRF